MPKTAPTDEEDPETRGRQKRLLIIAVSAILVSALGYYFFFAGPSGPRERTVYPAEGIVRYQGKPATGARVSLIPEQPGKDVYAPYGETGADGTFKLTTYRIGDGAPVGHYKVSIIWMTAPQESAQDLQRVASGQVQQPVDRLQDKYSDPNTSGLKAEIKAESPNRLAPFDLQ